MKEESAQLTAEEMKLLKKYLREMENLKKKEPEELDWDKFFSSVKNPDEIPAEYRDRIGIEEITLYSDIDQNGKPIDYPNGKTTKTYYDILRTNWLQESRQLDDQYHDIIKKALQLSLSSEDSWKDFLQKLIDNAAELTPEKAQLLTENLLSSEYLPMLNGAPTNEIMKLTKSSFIIDTITKKATYTYKNGHKITIEHFDKLQGALSISAKKILDTAVLYLTNNNYYRGNRKTILPTVEIPLIEYGEANGYQLTPRSMETEEEQEQENEKVRERLKYLKKGIRRDLHDISSILWTGEETRGRNKGDYKEMRIISSHSISNGLIKINFDIEAATYLNNAYIMQFPTALLEIDNRNPNPYNIGRKIAFHNSNDQNRAAGTESTLSVKSLLSAAPEIPTIEEIKARGQRNWKEKIKKPLEAALDEIKKVNVILVWQYRDPTTGATYDAETAQPLTWNQYSRLMVDFTMNDAPEQAERRLAKEKAKEEAAARNATAPKKRGRPKKQEEKNGGSV